MNIEELFKIIEERIKHKKKKSYTNKLLQLGPNKIAQNMSGITTDCNHWLYPRVVPVSMVQPRVVPVGAI